MSLDRYISHKQYTMVRSNDYIVTFTFPYVRIKKSSLCFIVNPRMFVCLLGSAVYSVSEL